MLEAGAAAPDFTLPGVDGTPWRLADALRNGRVLVAFFKITCPTCQFAMKFLSRIPAGLQVITVSQDDSKGTSDFQRLFHSEAPALLDAAPRYEASNAYRITHVPSLFSIEPDGTISKSFNGFNKADFEELGVAFQPEDRVPEMRPG